MLLWQIIWIPLFNALFYVSCIPLLGPGVLKCQKMVIFRSSFLKKKFLHKMFHSCAFLGQMSLVGLLYIQINKYELPREFPVIFVKPNASLYILRYRAILRYIHLYCVYIFGTLHQLKIINFSLHNKCYLSKNSHLL